MDEVAVADTDPDMSDAPAEDAAQNQRTRKTASDRRRDMPPGLYELINPQSDACIRISGLKFFNDTTHSVKELRDLSHAAVSAIR
jgi:hypothetical protein